MTKRTPTNIVEVWNWLINVLESDTLTATEQAILVHVIAKFNRTLWTPTALNKKMLAAAVNKDTRTITAALAKFVDNEILTETEGVYYLANVEHNTIPARSATAKFQFADTSQRDSARHKEPARPDTAGTHTRSESTAEGDKPARKRRDIFKQDNAEQP